MVASLNNLANAMQGNQREWGWASKSGATTEVANMIKDVDAKAPDFFKVFMAMEIKDVRASYGEARMETELNMFIPLVKEWNAAAAKLLRKLREQHRIELKWGATG